MPLLLRSVEPSHISRGTLPDRFKVQNDLEAVANGTLSNVIRQLSSLSHYAQELFTDLISVGSEIATRANNLQARVDRLAVRVGQIDSIQEESSIQDSLNTKPFSAAMSFDQQVVARSNLPAAMSKTFELCDKPPPLDKLNVYRDDGRDGLKFYTDPSYFFDLWRQEMLKDTERAIDKGRKPHKPKHDGQNRHKKRVRQPPNTRERQRHLAIEQGELLMPVATTPTYNRNQYDGMIMSQDGGHAYPSMVDTDGRPISQQQRPDIYEKENSPAAGDYVRPIATQHQQYEAYQRYLASQTYDSQNYRNGRNGVTNGYRPSQPPPAPPPSCVAGSPANQSQSPHSMISTPTNNISQGRPASNRSTPRDTLPPPPPPPVDNTNHINQFPPPPIDDEPLPPPPPTPIEQTMLRPSSIPEEYLPPSPPPPPAEEMVNQLAPPPPPPLPLPTMNKQSQQNGSGPSNSAKKNSSAKKSTVRDGRSELLKSIRDGIALRKVETKDDAKLEEKPSTYHDVASILARRVAVEMSDSDSGSSEYDSDGWASEG